FRFALLFLTVAPLSGQRDEDVDVSTLPSNGRPGAGLFVGRACPGAAGERGDGRRAHDDQRREKEDGPVASREVEDQPARVRAEGARAVVEEVRRAEDGAVVRRPEELTDQRRGQRRRREERCAEQSREEVELPGLADYREV